MKINRKTVARYRRWAKDEGLSEGALPSVGELTNRLEASWDPSTPPQNTSSVEPYRKVVERLRGQEVEVAAVYQRLMERGYRELVISLSVRSAPCVKQHAELTPSLHLELTPLGGLMNG